MITRTFKYLLSIVGLFSFLSCQKEIAYYSFQPIPITGWTNSDTLSFVLPEKFQKGFYDVYIGVRNKNNYPYKDLWLRISHNLDGTKQFKYEKIHFFVANPDGTWKGVGISGLYQSKISYLKNIEIGEEKEVRVFRIIPFMRDESLKGLSDIGLLIKHHQ